MTDNVVIKVPIFDYFTLPDVIKHCVGNNEWNEGKFSVEIEEIYVNEILEHVFLYFGNAASVNLTTPFPHNSLQITQEEEEKFLF